MCCTTSKLKALQTLLSLPAKVHFEHEHSAVLSLPGMQCHAAVPLSPSGHGNGHGWASHQYSATIGVHKHRE